MISCGIQMTSHVFTLKDFLNPFNPQIVLNEKLMCDIKIRLLSQNFMQASLWSEGEIEGEWIANLNPEFIVIVGGKGVCVWGWGV